MNVRKFDTGATRNADHDKLDFDGFLSPLALERFAEYMHAHRKQENGEMRDSDNWQKGIPTDAYMKSAWRHFRSWWRSHRGYESDESIEESLCALLFNVQGYLHEHLKAKVNAGVGSGEFNSGVDDGWIEWNGGECPIHSDTIIEVMLRDAESPILSRTASKLRWDRKWLGGDIVAYRVVSEPKTHPMNAEALREFERDDEASGV